MRGPVHRRGDGPGAVAATGEGEAEGAVDDVDVRGEVVQGVDEVDVGLDADEQQGGRRGHVVDDLRHRGAVTVTVRAGAPAEVGGGVGGERVAELLGVPVEVRVEDRDALP